MNMREVVSGIMYVLSPGCQWRHAPKDFPSKTTLRRYFDLWNYDGALERIHHALYAKRRERMGREASPTACVIDGRSVKSAERGGRELTRTAMMREKRSRAKRGIFSLMP